MKSVSPGHSAGPAESPPLPTAMKPDCHSPSCPTSIQTCWILSLSDSVCRTQSLSSTTMWILVPGLCTCHYDHDGPGQEPDPNSRNYPDSIMTQLAAVSKGQGVSLSEPVPKAPCLCVRLQVNVSLFQVVFVLVNELFMYLLMPLFMSFIWKIGICYIPYILCHVPPLLRNRKMQSI